MWSRTSTFIRWCRAGRGFMKWSLGRWLKGDFYHRGHGEECLTTDFTDGALDKRIEFLIRAICEIRGYFLRSRYEQVATKRDTKWAALRSISCTLEIGAFLSRLRLRFLIILSI